MKQFHIPKIFKTIFFFILLGSLFSLSSWGYKEYVKIPDSLLEFREKYPESAAFVSHYPYRILWKKTIDLSEEIKDEHIPLFLQWDERWGYETYGSDFLAVTGCGPTCISMVICGLTKRTDCSPLDVARFSESQGYYVPGEGTSWNLMTEGAEALGLQADAGEVSIDYINTQLANNIPLICSMYPGDFTYTGHFIVLTGMDSSGKIQVNDPNSPQNSQKNWDIEALLPQIRYLWKYSLPS